MNDFSNPSINEIETSVEPQTNSASPAVQYFCITPGCKEKGLESPKELTNIDNGIPTCLECRQPMRSTGDDIEAEATVVEDDPAAGIDAQRQAEVEEILKSAGISREDIENWSTDEPTVETASPVAEPAPPSPKLAEIVDSIPVNVGLPEYPVELVAKAIQNNLSKLEVEQFVGDVKMSLSLGEIKEKAFSIVVTDAAQTDLIKQARELRLRLKHERNRIDANAAILKEPHLRRIQIIDPLRKHIGDMFRECEAHLKLQEEFVKIQEERQQEIVRQQRWEELTALGMENLADLNLGQLTADAYESIRNAAQTAFDLKREAEERAAAERLRLEQKAQIKTGRVERLSQLGLTFNGMDYGYENVAFPTGILDDGDDAQFENAFSDIKVKVDVARQFKADQAAKAQKILERKSQLVALGLICDGTGCRKGVIEVEFAKISEATEEAWSEELVKVNALVEIANRTAQRIEHVGKLGLTLVADRYVHAETDAVITLTDIEQLDTDTFKPVFLAAKTKIDAYRCDQAEKAAKAEELLEQQRKDEAAAELRRMAPDKDKILALADDLETYAFPEVESEIGTLAINDAKRTLDSLVKTLRGFASQIEIKEAQ